MVANTQTSARTIVIRLRLRSAAVEPRAAPPAPPNMSDRPPPRPLWSRMPATMPAQEITQMMLVIQVMTLCTADQVTSAAWPPVGQEVGGESARKGTQTSNFPRTGARSDDFDDLGEVAGLGMGEPAGRELGVDLGAD